MTASMVSGAVWCQIEQMCAAPCEVVYDVLLDVERWPEWAPSITAGRWDRQGLPETAQDGVRSLRSGGEVIRDRVLVGHRPHYHSYVTSLPHYWTYGGMQTDVRINECGKGSRIEGTVSCMARTPALAGSVECRIQFKQTEWMTALAAEAERRYRKALGVPAAPAVHRLRPASL